MDMRFGLWNVRSLYRAGSLMTVSRELTRYKLDLVGVQEIRSEGSGTEPEGEYIFFYGKGNDPDFYYDIEPCPFSARHTHRMSMCCHSLVLSSWFNY
jgi:hypothetical protein